MQLWPDRCWPPNTFTHLTFQAVKPPKLKLFWVLDLTLVRSIGQQHKLMVILDVVAVTDEMQLATPRVKGVAA